MQPDSNDGHGLKPLTWHPRAIVLLDVVESVRLVRELGAAFVERWRALVADVRSSTQRTPGARIVRSLGDGLLIEAPDAPAALALAFGAIQAAARANAGCAPEAAIVLRMGCDLGPVAGDDFDIYGDAVNMAARLAARAAPGEVLVTQATVGAAVDGVDAWFEDLGSVYLKHVDEPVAVWRARAPAARAAVGPAVAAVAAVLPPAAGERPLIALVPLRTDAGAGPAERALAGVLAEAIVFRLARSEQFRVCSQLSMRAFEGRELAAADIAAKVGAQFLVAGALHGTADGALASLELVDAASGDVLWADRLRCRADELLASDEPHGERVAEAVVRAIGEHALRRAKAVPPPSLDAFALQLGAVRSMHRPLVADFGRARELLEQLIDRHPRAPMPHAWLAKWFVLRATRGLAGGDPQPARALDHARRAVDLHPDSAFAHAMEAFVHCHLMRDLPQADRAVEHALQASPSEPLAWLVRCVVHGFRGDGDTAWDAAQRALSLSPLDPIRHYFEALAASAAVAARRLDEAIVLAERSLQVNRDHLPTLRVLAVSLSELGRADAARQAVGRILEVDPGFTVAAYLASGPPGAEGTRRRYAAALREAGAPPG